MKKKKHYIEEKLKPRINNIYTLINFPKAILNNSYETIMKFQFAEKPNLNGFQGIQSKAQRRN